MDKERALRIVFMGTPEFAVASLRALVEGGFNVVAVVTMPDKPKGRHQDSLTPSPVKLYAQERGIPVLQPPKLKAPEFLSALRSYQADLQVVVAFRMLPEEVWAMPPLGTFNLHAALLPQYRGAAPINWALINGETETGVTTFFLDKDIDTGLIIHQEPMPISETDNAEDLHDRLMVMGASLVVRTVRDIEEGRVQPLAQASLEGGAELRTAPKLHRETCELRFESHTARSAFNFVRGLSPYPAAWTILRGKQLKLFEARIDDHPLSGAKPGDMDTDGRTFLRFACQDGWLSVLSLQLEGKRRMPVADFLRGYNWTR
ncbi:MAG: methionyl-tRNA formyltransferase [Prevotellaceae bacterium]|nr:methionyl-tRNA formyltransferase [Prevotellaceae bacterium]